MVIHIVNGPNLNLLGRREPHIYGSRTFEEYFAELQQQFEGQAELRYFQSNHEGELIDYLHAVGYPADGAPLAQGILLNAGAYTHTSIAIADAIGGIPVPVVEVHISNVYAREPFRHKSYLSAKCVGCLVGLGLDGYRLGIAFFLNYRKK
jgi:3-dehydroquinate dehydratase-2